MTEKEFVDRFTKRVVELAKDKILPFNKEPSVYGYSVGPVYWRERFPDGLEPEQCAEEDAAYW